MFWIRREDTVDLTIEVTPLGRITAVLFAGQNQNPPTLVQIMV